MACPKFGSILALGLILGLVSDVDTLVTINYEFAGQIPLMLNVGVTTSRKGMVWSEL